MHPSRPFAIAFVKGSLTIDMEEVDPAPVVLLYRFNTHAEAIRTACFRGYQRRRRSPIFFLGCRPLRAAGPLRAGVSSSMRQTRRPPIPSAWTRRSITSAASRENRPELPPAHRLALSSRDE